MYMLRDIIEKYKPVLQPIKIKSALELWNTDELPVAKLEWVHGPRKLRDLIRKAQPPVEDVSIEALINKGLIKVLEPLKINDPGDANKISDDVDALIMGDMEDWLVDEEILEAIVNKGKPIIYEWDHWGRAIHGRLSKLRFDRFKDAKFFIPMNSKEVKALIRALRGIRFLRYRKILYIGKYPPRSVAVPKGLSLEDVSRIFGLEIIRLDFNEYYDAVENADERLARDIAARWLREYAIMNGREQNIVHYAKLYLGLKNLLRKYNANSLTIECPGLKDTEYVPCLAFSHFIDEGIPCGCEADIPTLLTMALLMGISGEPATMGNLNENVTHSDLESNIVVINHDVVTKSYGCPGCKYRIRNFHASGKGATSYVELPMGLEVTLAGMHWNLNKIWATRGKVAWTEDTIHCRISIGVRVDDAINVSRNAFGHHAVLIRGDYVEELKMASKMMGIEFHKL